jgi:hypothetical protein
MNRNIFLCTLFLLFFVTNLFAEITEIWSDDDTSTVFSFESAYSLEKGNFDHSREMYLLPIPNWIFAYGIFSGKSDNGISYSLHREIRYNYSNNEYDVYGKIGPQFVDFYTKIQQEINDKNEYHLKKNFFGTYILRDYKIVNHNVVWNPYHRDLVLFQNKSDNDIYLLNNETGKIVGVLPFADVRRMQWSPLGDRFIVYGVKYKGGSMHNYIYDSGLSQDTSYNMKLIEKINIVREVIGDARAEELIVLLKQQ